MKKSLIIGIAGGTGSGKTTVAQRLQENLGPGGIVLLPQDAYYRDMSDLPDQERAKINFDHPDAIESGLLAEHIGLLAAGKAIDRPVYDFVTHTRKTETVLVKPARMLAVEGILLFTYPEIRNLLDILVYVDTDDDIRFIRRLRRDMENRGRTVDSVIEQYVSQVRPMHKQFVEPTKDFADFIVPVGGYNHEAIELLLARIRRALRDINL